MLNYVTWMNSRNVSRVVRGEDRRVLHLHGHWDESDSVVLGIRSYEAVKNSEHTQAVMKAFSFTRSFLFFGCGKDGLSDPNFGNFMSWLERLETNAEVEHRHYCLVREQDVFKPRGRLYPICYGKDYDDLPAFLQRLLPPIS